MKDAEFNRYALIIAGEGERLSPSRFLFVIYRLTSEAAPEMCGAARLVPDDHV
jgi:hypothetical protein